MDADPNVVAPQYARIRDDLVAQITARKLQSGDRLPSLREIGERYDVSSITARRVLGELVNERIAERRDGLGTFVIASPRRLLNIAVLVIGYAEESWRRNGDSFGELIGGIARSGWERQARMTIVPIPTIADISSTVSQLLSDQRLDGVLLRIAGDMDWSVLDLFRQQGVSVVAIKRSAPDALVPSVLPDAVQAGLAAGRHLLELGHDRIALIASTASVDTYVDHRAGLEQALREHSRRLADDLVKVVSQPLERFGRKAAMELLRRPNPPTAIVCNSDLLALGVYGAARARNLVIGDDLSVVSFDDMEFAAHLEPPLTTVRLSYFDLGRRAADTLFASIEGEPLSAPLQLATELIIRDSTSDAPSPDPLTGVVSAHLPPFLPTKDLI